MRTANLVAKQQIARFGIQSRFLGTIEEILTFDSGIWPLAQNTIYVEVSVSSPLLQD